MSKLHDLALQIKARNEHLFRKPLTFTQWISEFNPHIRAGVPWTTSGHEYMKEIIRSIDAGTPFIVVEKAAQVGISTAFLMESFYMAEAFGAKSLYFFPTDSAIRDFSQDRANAMLQETPHLAAIAQGIDNVHLKAIGSGRIYFRGMFSKIKVKSVDGDLIYLDELDESKNENVQFARDRLLHSSIGYERSFSQPSVPDYGIDAEFKKGTQEYWHLKCPACGHYQCLELNLEDSRYPMNFMKVPRQWKGGKFPIDQIYYRGCLKCHEPLDMSSGEMVASFPGKRVRSFHLSQLYANQSERSYNIEDRLMDTLMDAHNSHAIKRAVISIIGFPYVDSNLQPVNDTVLQRATGDRALAQVSDWGYMGVDQGDILSIVIGDSHFNKLQVIYLEQTADWKRLYTLMDQFNIQNCIIDAMPNKSDAKRFAAAFPGRVTIQYFKQNFKQSEELFIDDSLTSNVPVIHVDRTESLDDTVYDLVNGQIILPLNETLLVEDLHRHLKNLYREKNEETGMITYKKLVENHYGMALNSARLAMIHDSKPTFVGLPPRGAKR